MLPVTLSAVSKQTVNVLWRKKKPFAPFSLSPLVRAVLSEANSSVSAQIRVTATAEGVTVVGTGTLPCSVLVHYSIISQWSPHKSELCATRGEVPYGTSDPERQRVAKDPQSPTSQLLQGPPSPSLIDFNNRLRGGRMLSFIGLMGLFPGPSANTAALRAVCLDCL